MNLFNYYNKPTELYGHDNEKLRTKVEIPDKVRELAKRDYDGSLVYQFFDKYESPKDIADQLMAIVRKTPSVAESIPEDFMTDELIELITDLLGPDYVEHHMPWM